MFNIKKELFIALACIPLTYSAEALAQSDHKEFMALVNRNNQAYYFGGMINARERRNSRCVVNVHSELVGISFEYGSPAEAPGEDSHVASYFNVDPTGKHVIVTKAPPTGSNIALFNLRSKDHVKNMTKSIDVKVNMYTGLIIQVSTPGAWNDQRYCNVR